MDMLLEMELGITGGEEDGVNNENANPEDLYTKPEEVRLHHTTHASHPRFTPLRCTAALHRYPAPLPCTAALHTAVHRCPAPLPCTPPCSAALQRITP